jgi:hypothetical protein
LSEEALREPSEWLHIHVLKVGIGEGPNLIRKRKMAVPSNGSLQPKFWISKDEFSHRPDSTVPGRTRPPKDIILDFSQLRDSSL